MTPRPAAWPPRTNWYARCVIPHLTALAMRSAALRVERARFVPYASGVVLEVGIGSVRTPAGMITRIGLVTTRIGGCDQPT